MYDFLNKHRGLTFTTGDMTAYLKDNLKNNIPHPHGTGIWLSHRCSKKGCTKGARKATIWIYPKE